MDAALRTRLTRLGCTQAHLDLFVHNELNTVSDVQGLQDIDLDEKMIPTRKMITPEPDLHLAALLDGERARGKTTADALLNPIEWTRTVSCARRALCLFVCLFAVLWLSRKLDKR